MINPQNELLAGFPLLSLLLLIPAGGALLIWLPGPQTSARWVALGTLVVDLFLSLVLLANFDPARGDFQWVEHQPWIPSLRVHYLLGVDGLSVLFLPLSLVLFIGLVIASWTSVRTLPRVYFSLILLLAGSILGVFCALDTILFFLFWEFGLLPLYFLISLWGIGPHRRYAAAKYTLYMLLAGVPLLFGFVLLAFNHAELSGFGIPEGLNFDYRSLVFTPLDYRTQLVVFGLLCFGFAVKTPVFPFHTWLPVVAMEGPVAVTALMTGLKLGVYGLLRFVIPLAPEAARSLHWLLAGLGVVGILYGALAALAQTNLRRMLAYSSLSHVGLVVLGIASLNLQGVQGALFQLLNFTVIAGGTFLLTSFLHHRIGSTDVASLGGVAQTMPRLAGFYLLFGLAALGIPLTSGFPAELLILLSALETHTGAGLAALFGLVLGAAYFLDLYRRAFLGPVRSSVVRQSRDLLPRELALAIGLGLLVFLPGLWPNLVLDFTRANAVHWVERVQQLPRLAPR